jgi:uroporphyrinogen-III synthase
MRAAITRPPDATAALGTLLAEAGGSLAAYPLIRIEPTQSPALARAAARIEDYDWVVVTSAHAAAALAAVRAEAGWPAGVRVAAVGPMTAGALERSGIPVTAVAAPGDEHGPGLVRALNTAERQGSEESTPLAGRRVLYPCSDRARPAVRDGLRAAGATVEVVEAYRNLPDRTQARALAAALLAGRIDGLVLTSPSNVEALIEAAATDWPRLLDRVRVIALGPSTAAELAARGRPPDVEAASPDPRALARALTEPLPAIEDRQPRSRDRVSNE